MTSGLPPAAADRRAVRVSAELIDGLREASPEPEPAGSLMLEKPEVWGAQELSSKEVTMRLVAKTTPMRQWEVARELRARVKAVLDAAGVQPAGPDTIVVSAPPAIAAASREPAPTPAPVKAEAPLEDPLVATDLPEDDGASARLGTP